MNPHKQKLCDNKLKITFSNYKLTQFCMQIKQLQKEAWKAEMDFGGYSNPKTSTYCARPQRLAMRLSGSYEPTTDVDTRFLR